MVVEIVIWRKLDGSMKVVSSEITPLPFVEEEAYAEVEFEEEQLPEEQFQEPVQGNKKYKILKNGVWMSE